MDIMFWTFPDRAGRWSVAPGKLDVLDSGTGLNKRCMRVVWVEGVPRCVGTGSLGTRWKEGLAVQQGEEPHMVSGALKFDSAKPKVELLFNGMPEALLAVAKVLTYGFEKYGGAHGWKALDNAVERYQAALLRHQLAIASGEDIDPESGHPHAAHVACNAMFLLHFQQEKMNASQTSANRR